MRAFVVCVIFWPLFVGVVGDEDAEERIINGFPYRFPEMVSVHYKGNFLCSGLIYDKRNIITIGSCGLRDQNIERGKYVIKAGDYRLRIKDSTEQKIAVEEIIVHPKFKGNRLYYDIAVMKLVRPLEFNEYVAKVDIPDPWRDEFLSSRAVCMLGGWGVNEDGDMSWTSQGVFTTLMHRGSCRKYLDEKYDMNFSPRLICTNTPGRGACNADYGGIVACLNSNLEVFHFGMIFGHDSNCTTGFAIHLRLSKFKNWLAGVTD